MDANDDSERDRSYCNSITSEPERDSLLSAESLTESGDDPQDHESQSHGTNSSAAQAAKAVDIAEGNDTWVPSTPSRPASLATTRTTTTTEDDLYVADERQALLIAGPPPPDYAQATARQEIVPRRSADEESLYTAHEDISSAHLSRHPWKARLWRSSVNRGWKSICLISLVVYCILTAMLFIVPPLMPHRSVATKLDLFPPDHPANNRDRPQDFHQTTPHCHFDSFSEFQYFGWIDPAAFAFIDTVQESDYEDSGNVSISGRVEVRPAPYGQNEPITVITNFAKTSTWRAEMPKWDLLSPTLRIYSSPSHGDARPETEHGDLRRSAPNRGACLDIWVGIYIKTQLDNFTLHTETMDIDIGTSRAYENGRWSFRIRNKSRLHSRRGNVTASYWDSRIAHITSESGSITGEYGLNDNLALETKSGDIVADIWQEAAHEKRYLSSHPPNTPANLSTTTRSGAQNLIIWQGLNGLYWAGLLGLGYPYLLNSYHYSQTRSIALQTGDMWEGRIHATSVNGSINLRGNELEFLPDPNGSIPIGDESKHIWAKKGSFGGRIRIETPTGNISICTDDEFTC